MKRRTPYRFSRPAPSTARPPHLRCSEWGLYYYGDVMRYIMKCKFGLLALVLVGCSSYHPATIGISDRNGIPIEGASVTAAPLYFFNPSSESNILAGSFEILEPFPAKGDGGNTDEEGQITLNLTTNSPSTLTIYAEGIDPWSGEIELTKKDEVLISAPTAKTNLVVNPIH